MGGEGWEIRQRGDERVVGLGKDAGAARESVSMDKCRVESVVPVFYCTVHDHLPHPNSSPSGPPSQLRPLLLHTCWCPVFLPLAASVAGSSWDAGTRRLEV